MTLGAVPIRPVGRIVVIVVTAIERLSGDDALVISFPVRVSYSNRPCARRSQVFRLVGQDFLCARS